MPGKDGSGPSGRGPYTGRGSGYCSPYDAQKPVNTQEQSKDENVVYGVGRGGVPRGRKRGEGRGFGRCREDGSRSTGATIQNKFKD